MKMVAWRVVQYMEGMGEGGGLMRRCSILGTLRTTYTKCFLLPTQKKGLALVYEKGDPQEVGVALVFHRRAPCADS